MIVVDSTDRIYNLFRCLKNLNHKSPHSIRNAYHYQVKKYSLRHQITPMLLGVNEVIRLENALLQITAEFMDDLDA